MAIGSLAALSKRCQSSQTAYQQIDNTPCSIPCPRQEGDRIAVIWCVPACRHNDSLFTMAVCRGHIYTVTELLS